MLNAFLIIIHICYILLEYLKTSFLYFLQIQIQDSITKYLLDTTGIHNNTIPLLSLLIQTQHYIAHLFVCSSFCSSFFFFLLKRASQKKLLGTPKNFKKEESKYIFCFAQNFPHENLSTHLPKSCSNALTSMIRTIIHLIPSLPSPLFVSSTLKIEKSCDKHHTPLFFQSPIVRFCRHSLCEQGIKTEIV